jgi:hypothetical protein
MLLALDWTTWAPIAGALAVLLVPLGTKLLRSRAQTASAAGSEREAKAETMAADFADLAFEVFEDHQHGKAITDALLSASRTPEMKDFIARGAELAAQKSDDKAS